MSTKAKKWAGRTAVVLASGPSLTTEDIELVRQADVITIAVNSTWKVAPFCDVLYAGDNRWWKAYGHEVNIPAKRLSRNTLSDKRFKARYTKTKIRHGYNSGQAAVEYAIQSGADLVIMLGFDCSIKNGIHHHGPHDKTPNPTEGRCIRWHDQFEAVRNIYDNPNVVNCSRYTELEVFPRRPLEEVLCERGLISATQLKNAGKRSPED